MTAEFDIIDDYFNWKQTSRRVRVGIGDDAAVLMLNHNAGQELIVSVDTLVEGVHFPIGTDAHAIGHKALAVNLSDLAAMGADPAWFTLALSLPEPDLDWLQQFSLGLRQLAEQYGIVLIGGDTTCAPLSITLQVMGFAPLGKAVLRATAKSQDKIYVTGTLGDAAIGLALIQQQLDKTSLSTEACDFFQKALDYPQPQCTLSTLIRSYASSCLDISDGLLQDLTHILNASHVGAQLNLEHIPLSAMALTLGYQQALPFALSGGDDYQLLLTISPEKEPLLLKAMEAMGGKITCIGQINAQSNTLTDALGHPISRAGFQHFKT